MSAASANSHGGWRDPCTQGSPVPNSAHTSPELVIDISDENHAKLSDALLACDGRQLKASEASYFFEFFY